MFLDNHLTWEYHINQLSKKVSQANGILSKLRHNLGKFLDNHLTWEYHINQLSKKLSQANGILSKLRHNAPRKTVTMGVHYGVYLMTNMLI